MFVDEDEAMLKTLAQRYGLQWVLKQCVALLAANEIAWDRWTVSNPAPELPPDDPNAPDRFDPI